jgi:hypothetical protein
MIAGGRHRLLVVCIEQKYDALIGLGVGRHRRTINQEAYDCPIRVAFVEREKDRLTGCFRVSPCPMRQKSIVTVSPQKRVQRLEPLLR